MCSKLDIVFSCGYKNPLQLSQCTCTTINQAVGPSSHISTNRVVSLSPQLSTAAADREPVASNLRCSFLDGPLHWATWMV